jgi:esterase/lipase
LKNIFNLDWHKFKTIENIPRYMQKNKLDVSINNHSNIDIILIHGYSGSPTDFNQLPEFLSDRLGFNVYCQTLPGHATKIEDLYSTKLEDIIAILDKQIKRSITNHKKVILIGPSLGAQLGLYFATKYDISALIMLSSTHQLNFPLNIINHKILKLIKKSWPKGYGDKETKLRTGTVYYTHIPSDGIYFSKKIREITDSELKNITCPVLSIHSTKDRLGNLKGIQKMLSALNSKIKEEIILDEPNHNLFYSDKRHVVANEIVAFIKKSLSKTKK